MVSHTVLNPSRNRYTTGFTLIELMVVVGIIGLISAIVLATLNAPRDKSKDAAVKADLRTILTQSQIYFGDHGNKYNDGSTPIAAGATCPTGAAPTTMFTDDPSIRNAIAGATAAAGGGVDCYMAANGSAYVVWAPLKLVAGTYWCIDSLGNSKQKGAPQGASDLTC